MGGGDGIPRGKAILKNLIRSDVDSNIILVAGNNKKLKEDALHLTKKYIPTAGCIALSKKDFLIMLRIINKKTKIKIY